MGSYMDEMEKEPGMKMRVGDILMEGGVCSGKGFSGGVEGVDLVMECCFGGFIPVCRQRCVGCMLCMLCMLRFTNLTSSEDNTGSGHLGMYAEVL